MICFDWLVNCDSEIYNAVFISDGNNNLGSQGQCTFGFGLKGGLNRVFKVFRRLDNCGS